MHFREEETVEPEAEGSHKKQLCHTALNMAEHALALSYHKVPGHLQIGQIFSHVPDCCTRARSDASRTVAGEGSRH